MVAIKWGVLDGRVLNKAVRKHVQERIEKAGAQAFVNAKNSCPVDTGFMRSTIRIVNIGYYKFVLKASAFYTVFVHNGTSLMAARPFLYNAVAQAMRSLSRSKVIKATGFVKQTNTYPKR